MEGRGGLRAAKARHAGFAHPPTPPTDRSKEHMRHDSRHPAIRLGLAPAAAGTGCGVLIPPLASPFGIEDSGDAATAGPDGAVDLGGADEYRYSISDTLWIIRTRW